MASKKDQRIDLLEQHVNQLMDLVNVLNNAVVALGYATNVKGNELDKVSDDDYVKYVREHIHPLTRRATEIVASVAKKTKEEIEKKAAEEAEKEEK